MMHGEDVILVVDDIDINRMILREILQDRYRVIEAAGGTETLKILFEDKFLPTAVLLDIVMPDIDGFQVLEEMKKHEETKKIPVLFITAASSGETESRGLKAGAADYVTKPFNHDVVRARVDNHVELARYQNKLEQLVEKKASEAARTYEQTLEVLSTVIEHRNLESGEHIRRTTLLTKVLTEQMLNSQKFKTALENINVNSMIKASALHDIGKIGISDAILLKPGKLTDEEFEIMKTHTTIGSGIVDSIAATLPDNDMYLKYAKEICHFHHERWDGKGYPLGLKGEKIPISARILSAVDVYDALVNPRCYKAAYSHDVSLEIIMEGSGSLFDPDIVEILQEVSDTFLKLEESYGD